MSGFTVPSFASMTGEDVLSRFETALREFCGSHTFSQQWRDESKAVIGPARDDLRRRLTVTEHPAANYEDLFGEVWDACMAALKDAGMAENDDLTEALNENLNKVFDALKERGLNAA